MHRRAFFSLLLLFLLFLLCPAPLEPLNRLPLPPPPSSDKSWGSTLQLCHALPHDKRDCFELIQWLGWLVEKEFFPLLFFLPVVACVLMEGGVGGWSPSSSFLRPPKLFFCSSLLQQKERKKLYRNGNIISKIGRAGLPQSSTNDVWLQHCYVMQHWQTLFVQHSG